MLANLEVLMKKYKLILGGSKGIGKAIAVAFTTSKIPVVVVSRNANNLKSLEKELSDEFTENSNMYVSLDMTDLKNYPILFQILKRENILLDGLINNLPGGDVNTYGSFSYEELHGCIDKKLIPYLEAIKYASEYMSVHEGGAIINIIGGTWKKPDSNMFVNSMLNASLVNATLNLTKELAEKNISINCVHPGYIYTDRYITYRQKIAAREKVSLKDAQKLICQNIPFGLIGDPNELAEMVVFLTNKKSRYITGQNIDFDGGLSVNF